MTKMNTPRTRFSFVSDPGHGWLLVTPGELRAVGITEADISPYSYRSVCGELIALEEDCDAYTFLTKWEALIGKKAEVEDTADGLKFIRSWPRFGTKVTTPAGQGAAL